MSVSARTRRCPCRPAAHNSQAGSAKAWHSGNEIAGAQVILKLTLAIVLSSWTRGLFSSSQPRILRGGGWCRSSCSPASAVIVRGPHATSTAPPHQQSRHTCSGYGSHRSPEPCSCRSYPWPCIRAWLAPALGSVLSQRTQRTLAVRSMFICPRRDSSRDPDFIEVPNACVLWLSKQVTSSTKQEWHCTWQGTREPRGWTVPYPLKEKPFLGTGGLAFEK